MKKLVVMIVVLSALFTGCQKTPEKSAVVSKADGLSDELVDKSLKSGEVKEIDAPENWVLNETKSNGRVTISANLELGKIQTGNLPVIEMKNHELNQKELEKLTNYFAKDDIIYSSQIHTKDFFQKMLNRIENREGAYANSLMWTSLNTYTTALKKAIQLAPEEVNSSEQTKIKFQKKVEDPAYKEYESIWNEEAEQQIDNEIYFDVDIGENRESHIYAETYDSTVGNFSRFMWKAGSRIVTSSDVQETKITNDFSSVNGVEAKEYTDGLANILEQFDIYMQKCTVDEKEGENKAKQILKDLKIDNMTLAASEKVIWFPEESNLSAESITLPDDLYWQANLDNAQSGYQYTFSSEVGGIQTNKSKSSTVEENQDMYSPPFPVETVTIAITNEGIKYFDWNGIAEEVETIAENTKLASFQTIQEQLIDQIVYQYSAKGQPANDTTEFHYDITEAKLIYTYITAFEEPKNAWLVPAWYFVVDGGERELQTWSFTINALDCGVINSAK